MAPNRLSSYLPSTSLRALNHPEQLSPTSPKPAAKADGFAKASWKDGVRQLNTNLGITLQYAGMANCCLSLDDREITTRPLCVSESCGSAQLGSDFGLFLQPFIHGSMCQWALDTRRDPKRPNDDFHLERSCSQKKPDYSPALVAVPHRMKAICLPFGNPWLAEAVVHQGGQTAVS